MWYGTVDVLYSAIQSPGHTFPMRTIEADVEGERDVLLVVSQAGDTYCTQYIQYCTVRQVFNRVDTRMAVYDSTVLYSTYILYQRCEGRNHCHLTTRDPSWGHPTAPPYRTVLLSGPSCIMHHARERDRQDFPVWRGRDGGKCKCKCKCECPLARMRASVGGCLRPRRGRCTPTHRATGSTSSAVKGSMDAGCGKTPPGRPSSRRSNGAGP